MYCTVSSPESSFILEDKAIDQALDQALNQA